MEREQKLNQIDKNYKTYIHAYEKAIRSNLNAYNNDLLIRKAAKTISIFEKNKIKKKIQLKKLHPYVLEKPVNYKNNKYI